MYCIPHPTEFTLYGVHMYVQSKVNRLVVGRPDGLQPRGCCFKEIRPGVAVAHSQAPDEVIPYPY